MIFNVEGKLFGIKPLVEKIATSLIEYLGDGYEQPSLDLAGGILGLIKEAGYVKLADDQNLPVIPRGSYSNADYLRGQSDMLKAGWRKVELENRCL